MKRILMTLVLGCVAVASVASSARAEGKWGTAGCGVGSLIFEDKPGKIQILAATINAYFVQSSSITSGTSNCVEMSDRDQASLFITVNEVALREDVSRGSGEALAGLGKVLKCEDSERLASTLQRNYQKIFSADVGSPQVTQSIDGVILSDPALAHSCRIYG